MEQIEWQCPSCTLLNKSSSFKCRVCGTPKGTSTRQSKHTVAFEQQYLAASLRKGAYRSYNKCASSSLSGSNTGKKKSVKSQLVSKGDRKNKKLWPTLDNIDRSSGVSYSVTVGEVTVIITEYALVQNSPTGQ